MDVKEIREALIKLRDFAKRLDCDYQEECTPGEDDMCESCKHVYIADQAISALSAIDPEAIKRACADAAVDQFWKELREEAEVHCDRRIELLGKIETSDDAAIRKSLLDGWSAWILAKRIVSERNKRAAILQAEPGQEKKA